MVNMEKSMATTMMRRRRRRSTLGSIRSAASSVGSDDEAPPRANEKPLELIKKEQAGAGNVSDVMRDVTTLFELTLPNQLFHVTQNHSNTGFRQISE